MFKIGQIKEEGWRISHWDGEIKKKKWRQMKTSDLRGAISHFYSSEGSLDFLLFSLLTKVNLWKLEYLEDL